MTERRAARRAAFERALTELQSSGRLDPKPVDCAQCGAVAELHRIPVFVEIGAEVVDVRNAVVCPVCRVDRVCRWDDLIDEAADKGVARPFDPVTMTMQPYARVLSAAGFVKYDRTDGAWELTDAGLALLRERDARLGREARP